MQYISQAKLRQIIEETKGATFAHIVTVTDPKLKKTNNPFYVDGKCVIVKESTMNVLLNGIYENAVNNQRKREGNTEEFKAQERKWGNKDSNKSIVENNGNYYLQCHITDVFKTNYVDIRTGNVVPFEDIQEFLPSKKTSNTQGTNKEVVIRTFKMSSIKQININKEQYNVADY